MMTAPQWISLAHEIGPELIRWVAILIIALMFKEPLKSALSTVGRALENLSRRVTKVPGVQFESPTKVQKSPPTTAAVIEAAAIETAPTAVGDDPMLAEAVTSIAQRANAKPAEQRLAFVIREAGQLVVANLCLQIYTSTFGSQFDALRYANQAGTVGVDTQELKNFYDAARAQNAALYPLYSFENWLGYLVGAALLVKQNDRYIVTVRAQTLLQFIIRANLPDRGTLNNAAA